MTTTRPALAFVTRPALGFGLAAAGTLALFVGGILAAAELDRDFPRTESTFEWQIAGITIAALAALLTALIGGHLVGYRAARRGARGDAVRLPWSRAVVAGVGASALLLVLAMLVGPTLGRLFGPASPAVTSALIAVLSGMAATWLATPRGAR